MGNISLLTPFPATPVLMEKPLRDTEQHAQWRPVRAIISAITVPRPMGTENISQDSTPVDDTASLLLPKVVDSAPAPVSPRPGNAYGTFDFQVQEDEHTVVPLRPTSLVTSAALTPVYLVLMLLPMLPFWIFAGFLGYVAASQPLAETHMTLAALAFLLPFNTVGTVAVIRFAMGERRKAVEAAAETDVEIGPASRRSSGSGVSEKKRLWRPSMQFVLHGARREGRRI